MEALKLTVIHRLYCGQWPIAAGIWLQSWELWQGGKGDAGRWDLKLNTDRSYHRMVSYTLKNSNIRHTLVGNKIVDHSDVVGASPVSAALSCSWSIACQRCSNYIFILDLAPGFNGEGKDCCRMKREILKFRNLVHLILEIWPFILSYLYNDNIAHLSIVIDILYVYCMAITTVKHRPYFKLTIHPQPYIWLISWPCGQASDILFWIFLTKIAIMELHCIWTFHVTKLKVWEMKMPSGNSIIRSKSDLCSCFSSWNWV